jgi:hypothetical protein
MSKEKIDLIIDGNTYKGIETNVYQKRDGSTNYSIDTAGITQIIRQYVKNKYGAIKVWARLSRFAGGSSIGVDLWNVPNEWYEDVYSFANRFGKYNEPDGYGGDGYWRGKNVGATLIDGTPIENASPYVSVGNTPPWNAKERDMTPPDYSKSLPKKSDSGAKKGFKKFGEKKTEGFALVKSCGNGWNLFLKKEENSEKPYIYRLIKDYAVKPVGKEQFYALKGDMLEVGFLWSVKAQCFELLRFNIITDDKRSAACEVLKKYFPITETIPTEDLPPPPTQSTTKVPIKSITLVDENASYTTFKEVDDYFKFLYENESKLLQIGEGYDKYKIKFIWEDGSYITDRLDIAAYGSGNYNPFKESLSDYYKKRTDGTYEFTAMYAGDINTELKNLSFEDLSEAKSTDSIPSTKIPIRYIRLVDEYVVYSTFKEIEDYLKSLYENEDKLPPTFTTHQYKIEFLWKDDSRIVDRLDVSAGGKDDFNPFRESLSNYYKKRVNGTKEFTAYYENELYTSLENLSFEDLEKPQTNDSTEEVNLEQLIGDMNILIDLETDNDKRMELAGYRNDLQILLSLNN